LGQELTQQLNEIASDGMSVCTHVCMYVYGIWMYVSLVWEIERERVCVCVSVGVYLYLYKMSFLLNDINIFIHTYMDTYSYFYVMILQPLSLDLEIYTLVLLY